MIKGIWILLIAGLVECQGSYRLAGNPGVQTHITRSVRKQVTCRAVNHAVSDVTKADGYFTRFSGGLESGQEDKMKSKEVKTSLIKAYGVLVDDRCKLSPLLLDRLQEAYIHWLKSWDNEKFNEIEILSAPFAGIISQLSRRMSVEELKAFSQKLTADAENDGGYKFIRHILYAPQLKQKGAGDYLRALNPLIMRVLDQLFQPLDRGYALGKLKAHVGDEHRPEWSLLLTILFEWADQSKSTATLNILSRIL